MKNKAFILLFLFLNFQISSGIYAMYINVRSASQLEQNFDEEEDNSKENAEEKEFKFNLTDIKDFQIKRIDSKVVIKYLDFYLLKKYLVDTKTALLPPE